MANEKKAESFMTIADLWHLCIDRWRWFVASVFVCLVFAIYYLLTTPYLYTRQAAIMVREESMGKNSTETNTKEKRTGKEQPVIRFLLRGSAFAGEGRADASQTKTEKTEHKNNEPGLGRTVKERRIDQENSSGDKKNNTDSAFLVGTCADDILAKREYIIQCPV